MWANLKRRSFLNIFSSCLSKHENYDLSNLTSSSNLSSVKTNILLSKISSHQDIQNPLINSAKKPLNNQIIKPLSIRNNPFFSPSGFRMTTQFYEESKNDQDSSYSHSSFSKYLSLLGTSVLGYLSLKYKSGKNQREKEKTRYSNEETNEISNSKHDEGLIRNQLKNRVSSISYAANSPIEDRYNAIQLRNLDGYVVEVFDGHGGFQVADYASKRLHIYLDERLRALQGDSSMNEEEKIISAINYAFDSVEEDLYKNCKDYSAKGINDFIFIGSCALVIVIHNNKLYVANCGDSKAKLYSSEGSHYTPIKLTRTLNAGAKKEQNRLRSEYSDQDIFVCKRGSRACYVKGRLQPTRSLGDFYLKHLEFNTPEIRRGVKNFIKGPYIKYQPEIKIYELKENDRYIVLGTDGLWDELSPRDVAKTIKENENNKDKILDNVFNNALMHAAKDANMSLEEIFKVEPGRRKRNLHDDITILIVDLKNQI